LRRGKQACIGKEQQGYRRIGEKVGLGGWGKRAAWVLHGREHLLNGGKGGKGERNESLKKKLEKKFICSHGQ